MFLSVPAAIALAAAVVGLIISALAFQQARGPSMRELHWYAYTALAAVGAALSDLPMMLGAGDRAVHLAGSLNLACIALHGVAWFRFFAAKDRRRLTRLDRFFVVGGIVAAVGALVPGFYWTHEVVERSIAWVPVSYREPATRPAVAICYAFCLVGTVVLTGYAFRAARSEKRAAALALGFVVMLAGAVTDSLSALRVVDVPYVSNIGFLGLVLGTGTWIAGRITRTARSLEDHAARLEVAQTELVHRERLAALGELAAVVAHEVRNPLAVMFNALASLRRAEPPPEGKSAELMRIMEEEATRLRHLVSALLDFVRPYEPRYTAESLAALVAGAVDQALAAEARGEEAVSVELEDALELECDRDLVRQALANLVTNALQAPGRTSPVLVRATRTSAGKRVVLDVVDDGAGVAEGDLARLFTPFFTTRPTGTGLGLAFVKRVAQAHGGSVEVATSPGGGATFTLALPTARGVDPAAARAI